MKMKDTRSSGLEINVVRHLILRNFWEVYITDEETSSPDIRFALVMGYETELGDVYLPEYEGHIISDTKVGGSLEDFELAPADGWTWVTGGATQ